MIGNGVELAAEKWLFVCPDGETADAVAKATEVGLDTYVWSDRTCKRMVKGQKVILVMPSGGIGYRRAVDHKAACIAAGAAAVKEWVLVGLGAEFPDFTTWSATFDIRNVLWGDRPWIAAPPPSANGQAPAKLTIGLDEVVPEDVDWLWEDRIAIGFISIFAGRTGFAKSFIICDVAARLSRGDPPPFSELRRDPVRTLIISEDPLNVMLGPRLLELGAYPSRIRFATWEAMGSFKLDDAAMLDRFYEECGHPTMLVIDPPGNFLGDVDEHRNAEVRQMLMVLVKWLDEHKVACVLIMHINKAIGKGLDAVERIVGSVAWGACARITLAFARNPDAPEQYVCGGTKNNLGEIAGSLDYRIVKTDRLAKIEWIGRSETTIDDAINQVKKKSRGVCAVEWLTDRFREKLEWESDELRKLGAEYGISKNALWSEEVNALPIDKRPRVNASGDRYWVWIAQEGWPPLKSGKLDRDDG